MHVYLKKVVFVTMAFTSPEPSAYAVPLSLLQHAEPLVLKETCSWISLDPPLEMSLCYWTDNDIEKNLRQCNYQLV